MMDSLREKTLESLENSKILEALCGCSRTPYGAERTLALRPGCDVDQIRRGLCEASQLKDLLQFDDPFPLGRVADVRPLLDKAAIEGARLKPEDFVPIRETLTLVARLKAYKKGERENFPELAEYLERFGSFAEFKKEIDNAIDSSGEIRENASPLLRRISAEINDSRRRLIKKLEDTLSKRARTQGWQDDVITQRNGRYVIPIPASAYRSADGMVVDESQSGATFFVEPPFAVEGNNAISLALQKRRREIERILAELTATLRRVCPGLGDSLELIGVIDSLHSIATFSIKINASAPQISAEPGIDLISAFHPLLLYYTDDVSSIVPLDLALGAERLAILITGPNTGGKTVALKTVGLLALMAASGLLIPADPKSVVGVFDHIHADIGDEQSIELSLSTYSSHITKVIHAVRHAGPKSLLLFDEIGAGTDPAEGAALAEALILYIVGCGARLIVTTHYSQLKTLPLSHTELENASLEFDRESLRPTYRLQMGVPGSSYAIEIAERLGMPREIVDSATGELGSEERSLAGLISTMEEQLRQLRADSASLGEKLASSEVLERRYRARLEELERGVEEQKNTALSETEELVKNTRAELERIVREVRESQASKKTVQDAHLTIKAQSAALNEMKAPRSVERSTAPEDIRPGDFVWINPLKVDGEVAELVGDDRLKVRVGNMLNLVNRSEVTRANLPPGQTSPRRDPAGVRDETAPMSEIHLRGLTVEEAKEKLDKFLDSAILSGLGQVYVIHGKGTGTLRKALTAYLKEHPAVRDLRLGDWNQGGAGVTVVTLK
ncbi:MAG: endonuclease MutS2 [Candidatus Zixiibacteriota bacterium]